MTFPSRWEELLGLSFTNPPFGSTLTINEERKLPRSIKLAGETHRINLGNCNYINQQNWELIAKSETTFDFISFFSNQWKNHGIYRGPAQRTWVKLSYHPGITLEMEDKIEIKCCFWFWNLFWPLLINAVAVAKKNFVSLSGQFGCANFPS